MNEQENLEKSLIALQDLINKGKMLAGEFKIRENSLCANVLFDFLDKIEALPEIMLQTEPNKISTFEKELSEICEEFACRQVIEKYKAPS